MSYPCQPNRNIYTKATYDTVKNRMIELMPGWFTMLEEIMDSDGPEPHIRSIAIQAQKTGKNIDDLIHEYFKDDWFDIHEDYDEYW